jgi:hypothetical protein
LKIHGIVKYVMHIHPVTSEGHSLPLSRKAHEDGIVSPTKVIDEPRPVDVGQGVGRRDRAGELWYLTLTGGSSISYLTTLSA